MLQNLGDTAKEVLRGKLIVIKAYQKNKKKISVNILSRKKQIIKIRVEINEIEKKIKTLKQINGTNILFVKR